MPKLKVIKKKLLLFLGGKTLSLLHEKCVNQSLASTEKLRDLGLVLTRSAADCYFKVSNDFFYIKTSRIV